MTSYAGAILQEDAQRIIAALPAETIPAMQAIALAVGILAAKLECQCEGSGEVCLDSLATSFRDLPNTPEWRMILLLAIRPPALPWWLVAIGYLTCAGSLGICAATAVLVVFR